MRKIHIIVGSVTGTAEQVALFAAGQLQQAGHSVKLTSQFSVTDLQDAKDQLTLFCTSNTGVGDLPANIAPVLPHILSGKANLAYCPYAVINLGDSSFPNFAQAGQDIDDAMQDVGAQRFCETLVIDAIYDDDSVAAAQPWIEKLITLL